MKSRLLGGIAALLLAITGTILLAVYVQAADSRAAQGLNPVKVLVAKEHIPAGTKVEDLASKLKLESLPQSAVPAAALESLDGHAGKVTSASLEPDEQLLAAKLLDPKELVPGTVPVPDGLEEVTFLLAPERILGGRLEAGDVVTVYGSFKTEDGIPADANVPAEVKGWKQSTGLLFHDVLVTAVQKAAPETANSGSNGSSADSAVAMPNGSAFVTVARSDADAAKMVFGAEFGTLWLAKQTATSTKSQPPVTTFGGLY
ncbi:MULTISPECIES: Flp pilus assembly protein CpaB [unclassified Pseudarthrobacter]|uniref:Flp pilus assembly protein CpaB n=1 Tax=unclassified Pseudarthrobacter TaxID=2647000 RepID=UPI00162AC22C|nr:MULTISPECIES: pilus assembly protein CpaB [unclassified Pseudarthrobacter]MBE4719256.1 pilus assembly protein CpaB [Pseudarthrobacter sp. AB1]QNE15365.1 pilus assembly protein CpaB [Pseudarthrobacter sp. NBSH8]